MKPLAFDSETTGLELHRGAKMFAFSTCDWDGNTDVQRVDGSPRQQAQGLRKLRLLVQSFVMGRCIPIFHNAKFDLTAVENFLGERFAHKIRFFDTHKEAHLLLNDHPSLRLKDLSHQLLRYPRDDERDIRRYLRHGGNYSHVPPPLMDKYQRGDAQRTMLLHRFFYPMIEANPKYLESYRVERDLIPVTMRMERRGVMLHREKCAALRDKLAVDVESVLAQLEAIAGKRINPNKGADIRWLLYHQCRLPVLAWTKKTKLSTTKKEFLLELREEHPHPAIDLILQYRSWTGGIARLADWLAIADSDGLIHPSINTCQAITGRESCDHPNLQNVPKTGVLLNPYPIPARAVLRPHPDYILILIDYAGIELRLLVFYSREEELIRLIRKGGDPHALAAEVFYPPLSGVERQAFPFLPTTIVQGFLACEGKEAGTLRSAAKNTNFAIPYGAQGKKCAATLALPLSLGLRRFEAYRRRFPKLVNLNRDISAQVRAQGCVYTAFGRRIKVPRDEAYIGTNYLIQGTAAEIIKRAQIRVDRYLESATGGEVNLLLPVHDELIIRYPRKRLGDINDITSGIRREMIDFPQFDLPLDVEASVATVDWESKRKFNIPH